MHPLIWKTFAAFVLLCIIIQQIQRLPWSRQSPSTKHKSTAESQGADQSTPDETVEHYHWQYNWLKDRDDYSLSAAQCDAAFPELYYEIHRAATRWQGQHITPDMIGLNDEGKAGVHVLIADNKIRIVNSRGSEEPESLSRIHGILQQLDRAITSVEGVEKEFSNTEFAIDLDDYPSLSSNRRLAMWSSMRNLRDRLHDDIWVAPDSQWWLALPSGMPFEDAQARARGHSSLLDNKNPVAFWRGDPSTRADVHSELLEVAQDQFLTNARLLDSSEGEIGAPAEHLCDYRFLINLGDPSALSRLKTILNCDSVPIINDLTSVTHYSHLLETNISYVPVAKDFSNLADQVEYYLVDEEEAQYIADSARMTFRERYTTPAATACYWRKLLRVWSSVSFAPTLYGESYPQAGDWKIRGVSLDEYLYV